MTPEHLAAIGSYMTGACPASMRWELAELDGDGPMQLRITRPSHPGQYVTLSVDLRWSWVIHHCTENPARRDLLLEGHIKSVQLACNLAIAALHFLTADASDSLLP